MKYCCFLFLWDSWELKNIHCEGLASQRRLSSWKNAPLMNLKRMLLPPLQVKLGLMKNSVKAVDNSGEGLY
jgi:hypothetical protein